MWCRQRNRCSSWLKARESAEGAAVVVNYAKTYFTGALPEVWLYALGALFVGVTLFLPRGLVGLWPAGRRITARPEAGAA